MSLTLREYYNIEGRNDRLIPEVDGAEKHRINTVLYLLGKTEIRFSSVLDVGCGDGVLCSIYKRDWAERVTGIDISSSRISYARDHFDKIDYFEGDIYSLPFKSNSFELVSCVEVLEHIEDPRKGLEELARVSASHILVTVPYRWPVRETRCIKCGEKFFIDGHLHSFDNNWFKQVAVPGLKLVRSLRYCTNLKHKSFQILPTFIQQFFVCSRWRKSGYLGVLFEKPGSG
ncbi:MAG: class I SAM-dependent methyltransferase [Fidelibacterota bacterium]|jgi:ubiquinone/menaquinone biosynthesis C-methylase UbiE